MGIGNTTTSSALAAALAAGGMMSVYAVHGDSESDYFGRLKKTLEFGPDIVIDDGGDLALLLHSELKELAPNVMGGCEETTTGVHRLEILKNEGKLAYPVIAVNDGERDVACAFGECNG